MNSRRLIARISSLFSVWIAAASSIGIAQPPFDNLRLRIVPGGLINDLGQDTFSMTELSPTVFVDEVSGEVRGQIDRVEQFIENEQWPEAIEMLIRLQDRREQKLANSENGSRSGFHRYLPLHELVREQLSVIGRASPAALQLYRNRMDPLAEQWLSEGLNTGDEPLLRKLVREAFHSSAGDEALLALGDLALEAGQHTRARRYWQAIHGNLQWRQHATKLPYWRRLQEGESVSSVGKDLLKQNWHFGTYVDSQIPLADVWARLVLASILAGSADSERAALELSLMQSIWPSAEGVIGGRRTKYSTTLSRLLNDSRSWPRGQATGDWTTFAGNGQRNWRSTAKIDIPTKPDWRVPLQSMSTSDDIAMRIHNLPRERAGESRRVPQSHFPIVVGNLVLVQDAHRIRCLDVTTGEPAWSRGTDGTFYSNAPRLEAGVTFSGFGERQRPARLGEQRYTLTAAGDTLLATVGSHQGIGGSGNPALVGFDLTSEGRIQFGPVELADGWSFHGAPLADEGQCWVGLRLRDVSAQDFVASYDTRSGTELWRTRICSADTIGHNSVEEVTNYLLTKHEDTLYFSSHLGTVAAISARDGSLRWLTTYPRIGPKRANLLDEPFYALRDLTPCLFHDGLIIVCPSDSRKIFALHSGSGELIWETELAGDATQMLGVGKDHHLILSGRRLWWLDAYTGQLSEKVAVNPFPAGQTAEPRGAGRGILSDGKIYWPTAEGSGKIYVLDQLNGRLTRQPIDLASSDVQPGNLVLTTDHLLIASANELVAYKLAPEGPPPLKAPGRQPSKPAPAPRK